MATTSLWRVTGWLGKMVVYVENPDKTENPAYFEKEDMSEVQAQALEDVIEYAANKNKTQGDGEGDMPLRRFVSGVNCSSNTAREEMMAAKRRFGKETGTVAYHGYQSFAPGETTPEIAHEIGVKLAQRLWGDRYQVLVATHLDKANHLHNHFLVNTVSFIDGRKYHRTKQDYLDMRAASDRLCQEYGLSVIEDPQRGHSKHYGEWRAEQEQRPTWRGIVQTDVDEAIRQSMTERQFFDALRRKGYEIKMGKDISVRPPGKPRFVRLTRNFGESYSLDGIRRRILAQGRPERPRRALEEVPPKKYHVQGTLVRKKATGLRALYFRYCYLLGIFPKERKTTMKDLHFLLREDLVKLEAITQEARLLGRCHIDTAEQLSSYKSDVEAKIESVTAARKELYRAQRTIAVRSDPEKQAKVKEQIAAMSKELSVLRKEVRLCDGIADRSGVMLQKMEAVREDEESRGKENKRDEYVWRRGRTGR